MKKSISRRPNFFGFLVVLTVFLSTLLSCTESGTLPPADGTGTLSIQFQDAPLENLVKFEIKVTSIRLERVGFEAFEALPEPAEIELTSLQLSPELIRLAQNIPAGTYTDLTFTFADPEIKFCPDTVPPDCSDPQEVEPPLQNATVTKSVTLTIAADSMVGLLVDFNLQESVVTNENDDIIAVDPVLTCEVRNFDFEEDEFDEEGLVVGINRLSPTSGSFTLETFGSCQQITIEVNGETEFENFSEAALADSFESLTVGQHVEVEAELDGSGDFVAEEVELEDPEGDDEREVEGVIVSTDAANHNFTVVLLQVIPCSAPPPPTDLITVSVDPANLPEFRIDDDGDFNVDSSLFDDLGDLTPGQRVNVDTIEPVGSTVTAEKIKLKDQTVLGTVEGTPTGDTFLLNPLSLLYAASPITVSTSENTDFDDINQVTDLVDGESVRVKGLLFLEAGELFLEAKKVKVAE